MLYQKVRPKKLEDVVGNRNAVITLQNVVKSKEHPHCFLFRGPSGCGKTTLARIMANELQCSAINIIEKNAANERGIDSIRQLEDIAQYGPMGGGNRMVILDEAHALTKDAQNAILKLLEDMPSYAYYALCSTEPDKILKTIRTRSCNVEVGSLRKPDIIELLLQACEKAEIDDPSEEVLSGIAASCDGCPRTALMLLEKQDGLSDEDALRVVEGFEVVEKQVLDLCRALGRKPWNAVVKIYKSIDETDPEKIRRACLGYLHSCLVGAKAGEGERFCNMIEELSENTFGSGRAGLIAMLYRASGGE